MWKSEDWEVRVEKRREKSMCERGSIGEWGVKPMRPEKEREMKREGIGVRSIPLPWAC